MNSKTVLPNILKVASNQCICLGTSIYNVPRFFAIFDLPTLTPLIKGHARFFFSRKKSSLPSDFLPASTAGRVDFLSYPFIIAYPFIREVRVPQWKTVLVVSSRAFSLSTPTFSLSTPVENSEATWKKAKKMQLQMYK